MPPSMDAGRDGSLDIPHEMEAPPAPNGKGPQVVMNPEAVNNVMYSDIGIGVLLNRLKQSIASAKDFSSFLSKRARLEDDHVQALRKLSKATLDNVRRPESRQGSYASQVSDVCRAHDRMADHGARFTSSLQAMHLDLDELTTNMERGRKHWKSEGLANEKRVKDAEAALDKAKSKYDSTAESYDRARTGGGDSGRVFTVKGPKSAEKHEADLLGKLNGADSDYAAKVQAAQSARQENLQNSRPQAVKALQELIRECDAALTLQLQKYAAFSEMLLVGCGLEVNPLKNADGERTGPPSMREMINDIDNDRDFHGFMSSYSRSVPPPPAEIRYERNRTLGPQQQAPTQAPTINTAERRTSMPPQSAGSPSTRGPNMPTSSDGQAQPPQPGATFGSMAAGAAAGGAAGAAGAAASSDFRNVMSTAPNPNQPREPNVSQAPNPNQFRDGPPMSQAPNPNQYGPPVTPQSLRQPSQLPSQQPVSSPDRSFAGPPQQAQFHPAGEPAPPAYDYKSSPHAPQLPPVGGQSSFLPASPNNKMANGNQRYNAGGAPPPNKPVFGQSLDALFRRDDLAVPLVVYQCIQAVDLFGLDTEGIYRLSGDQRHINQMKALFDNDSTVPDFRNPSAFHHDVNSAAGLLKQFFRELSDPLLTSAAYNEFIDAAKVNDENVRRDSIHAVINGLPDPNYATLRALVLHLHRVMEHDQVNRMSSHNLAICFAPALMGQHTGPQIADAGLQARVLDTILKNTYQIFDED